MTSPAHATPVFYVSIAALCALTVFNAWTSRINRFFFFGRTLPRNFHENRETQRLTTRYILWICVGSLLSLSILVAAPPLWGRRPFTSLIIALLAQLLFFHLAFAWAHREAAVVLQAMHTSVGDETQDATEGAAGRSIAVSLLQPTPDGQLRLLVSPMLAAASLWLGAAAVSNGSLKEFAAAAGSAGGAVLEGIGCGLVGGAVMTRLLIRYAARARTPMARHSQRITGLLGWTGALIIGACGFAAVAHHTITRSAAHIVMVGILGMATAFVLSAWRRTREFVPPAAEQGGDQMWRWGLFYRNPGDPALFVQRRSGCGYTLNFGNRFSWPIAAAVVADFAFIFLSRHHL